MDTKKIAVVGMGYVGLTTGMSLAVHGFKTVCTDAISSKVDSLNRGILYFL